MHLVLLQPFHFIDQNQFQLKSYKDKHYQLANPLSQTQGLTNLSKLYDPCKQEISFLSLPCE
jgi:hypothetical protein